MLLTGWKKVMMTHQLCAFAIPTAPMPECSTNNAKRQLTRPPMHRSSANALAYSSSQCNAPGQQTECADIKCTGLCCILRPNRNGVLSTGAVFACARAELLLLFIFAAAVRSVCRFFSDCGQSGMQVRAAVQAGAMNCKGLVVTSMLYRWEPPSTRCHAP